jgi:hypothetical protein
MPERHAIYAVQHIIVQVRSKPETIAQLAIGFIAGDTGTSGEFVARGGVKRF